MAAILAGFGETAYSAAAPWFSGSSRGWTGYFDARSLEAQGATALSDYVAGKGTGFWVNR